MTPIRPARLAGALALTLAALTPVLACWGPELESVHFHDLRPDFLRMPEPWWKWPGEIRAIVKSPEEASDGSSDAPPAETTGAEPSLDQLAETAQSLEREERFPEAAAAWERYAASRRDTGPPLGQDGPPSGGFGPEARIAALRTWRGSEDTPSLQAYLKARGQIESGQLIGIGDLIQEADHGPLRPHAAYLRATVAFYLGAPEESAAKFREVLDLQPDFLPAQYMVGRASYAGSRELRRDLEAPPTAPERALLQQAAEAYEACARSQPTEPLAKDAAGMAAACRFRLGDYPEALLTYCRKLAQLPPGEDDSDAFISARWCLEKMEPPAHAQFQRLALDDPAAAAVYLDLILRYGRSSADANYRLGLFALDLLKRHPGLPLTGRLLTQLSTIEDRAGHADRAVQLAAQALRRSPQRQDADEARWAHALALHHAGRTQDGLREYERVADEALLPRMRAGAHEAAAVLSERLRDYPNALRHYFALEYRDDYAYVADCLATEADLRAFLKRFPSHPQCNLIRYSIGFRQLRAGKYDAAARTFSALGPWLQTAEQSFAAETAKGKPRMPPLEAARRLASLQRQEQTARSRTTQARAAYAAGQLMFRQRHLLFYNNALWQGARTWALDLHSPQNLEDSHAGLSPAEEATYRRYQEEHAALFQALQVFRRVADRYPGTPEAPRALYSAALCYSFLPSLERFWTNRKDLNYEREGIRLYRRLQREYPHDPLAAAAAKFGGPLPSVVENTP